jgi:hypothetical protein
VGGLFLVGEEQVEPAPDAVVDFDLQNGPDACRLRGPEGADVLGWGTPLDAAMREGAPAADAASGLALARLPDGADTDCNECDWRVFAPSPGEFNAPELAVIVEEAAFPPVDLAPGTPWEFSWTLRNVGRAPWSGEVRLGCAVHEGEALGSFAPFAGAALLAGERRHVSLRVTPPAGDHAPVSDPPFPNTVPAWRGASPDLAITEVFARPANDEQEWIEIRSTSASPIRLAEFRVEDEAGTSAAFEGTLDAGAVAVVAADTTGLRARWSLPENAALVRASPWPALNHTASAGEAAERVRLVLAGTVLEECALPGGIDEGLSWERVSVRRSASDLATWAPSLDSAGATPGRTNSRDGDRAPPVLPPPGALAAAPRTFAPARDGPALLVLTTRAPVAACTITLYDSAGIAVRRLEAWRANDLEHRALWDGRDDDGEPAPLGVYVACADLADAPAARATVVLLR